MLVCYLSLRPLESAFLSLSLPDILMILQRKLRSHISRRLIILVVTFHVSKAYKAVEGKFQVYSWSVSFRQTTLNAQTVWSCQKTEEALVILLFTSFVNVHNIRLYQVFNYFLCGFSRNITSSSVSPIFCILDILTLIQKPTFLLMCSTQPVINCISLLLLVNNTRSSAKYKPVNSLSYQMIPSVADALHFLLNNPLLKERKTVTKCDLAGLLFLLWNKEWYENLF